MKPGMIEVDNLQKEHDEKLQKLIELERKLDQVKINNQLGRENRRSSLNNESEYPLRKVRFYYLLF